MHMEPLSALSACTQNQQGDQQLRSTEMAVDRSYATPVGRGSMAWMLLLIW
jgi:hypothetical protein